MKEKLQSAMKLAMKAKEKEKLNTIRALLSAIQYAELEGPVDEQAVLALLRTEVKKRKEEREFVEQADRPEQIAAIDAEIAVIESFLPAQLSEEQLKIFVDQQIALGKGANIGELMSALKATYAGQYDGKLASAVIKNALG